MPIAQAAPQSPAAVSTAPHQIKCVALRRALPRSCKMAALLLRNRKRRQLAAHRRKRQLRSSVLCSVARTEAAMVTAATQCCTQDKL